MTNEPRKTTTKRKPTDSNSKAEPIYFLSLELENVLCFKSKERLDLSDGNGRPAQWTVILGNNGTGKTTLLRCLAGMEMREVGLVILPLLFGHDFDTLPSDNLQRVSGWEDLKILDFSSAKINAGIIRNDSGRSLNPQKAKISLSLGNPSTFNIEFDNTNEILSELLSNDEFKTLIEHTSNEGVSGEMYITEAKVHKRFLGNFYCYGYGAMRRMGKNSLIDDYITANSGSLFSDHVTLINAEEWLLQTDYAVKSSSGKIRKQFQKRFNQIIEILKRILPEIENIQIAQVDEENPQPRAEFLTPYGWVGLSSLGLGYRTMIAWMVDLAVRLFKRYPDSEDPLAEPAIVLVDEIDLHLHPKWQRTIMEFLTERFPNTQFIVTAHSPLVVQAAQDANIVLLRREGDRVVIDNNPEVIENWRVDQVLTSVFEMPSARPVKIEPWLKRRKEILTQPNLTESDRLELKELEAKIGTLPTAQNPEDIKAMDIIRRAAKLLENPQEKITE